MCINPATAQTVIEGKLLVLTLNDEARPGDGRMVKNQELFDLFQEFEVTDFQQAIAVLDELEETELLTSDELNQHNHLRTTYVWWESVHNSGKNLFSLTESDLTTLQGIYTQSAGKARAMTHNMIIALGLIDYQKSYILPEPELKQKNVRPRNLESKIGLPVLKVFPNPAKEYMIIECVSESASHSKLLQLVNNLGQLIMEHALDPSNSFSVVDLRYLPTGTYSGQVVVDGKIYGSFKVLISK